LSGCGGYASRGGMKSCILSVVAGVCALAASVEAKVVAKPVAYEHGGVKLEGWLAYDDAAEGKRPGVLVVHEWWGLNDYVRGRAESLARLGYVAFACDMYGAGVVTAEAKKAGELAGQFYGKPLMAERARAGLDQLLATGMVAEGKVAAIGFCFGGSTSQALAYSGAPLAGIVSFHGGPVPAPAGAANKAKVLMLHGEADFFIKPEEIAAFAKSMNEGGFDWQWISYSGAVHAFSNPDADKFGIKGVAYQKAAAQRSWMHMQVFFAELFGR